MALLVLLDKLLRGILMEISVVQRQEARRGIFGNVGANLSPIYEAVLMCGKSISNWAFSSHDDHYKPAASVSTNIEYGRCECGLSSHYGGGA